MYQAVAAFFFGTISSPLDSGRASRRGGGTAMLSDARDLC